MVDPAARAWHAVTALVSGAALLLQLVLSATNDVETLPVRMLRLVSYFTIQSNLLVCVSTAWLALRPATAPDDGRWRVLRFAGLLGITVTGLVYVTVLRGTAELAGAWLVADAMLHYATPFLAVVGWLVLGPRLVLDRRVALTALCWPVAWLAYTLVHGAVSGWYPYPFLQVGELGYPQTLVNCAAVTVVLVGVAAAALALDGRLPVRGGGTVRARMHP